MNENILIVDDEKEIADLIEVYLKNDGYTVHKFYNGLDALGCIETQKMDLAILDVMLPDIDGFRICQKIREQYFYPIIILTAKVEDTDKIMGLTIGADDYITKPFNPLEVVARVKTQLRRYVRYNNAANTKEKAAPIAEHDVPFQKKSLYAFLNSFIVLMLHEVPEAEVQDWVLQLQKKSLSFITEQLPQKVKMSKSNLQSLFRSCRKIVRNSAGKHRKLLWGNEKKARLLLIHL